MLERFSPEFRERHIEAPRTGSLVAVNTFFVGTLKGVRKLGLALCCDGEQLAAMFMSARGFQRQKRPCIASVRRPRPSPR